MVETKEKRYVSDSAQLMAEWNFEKNINILPNELTLGCHKKVWWKCNNGHEWQASVAHRNNGTKCPYCRGAYAIKGENDLQTINPDLAREWNFEKNVGLTPVDILPSSNKKVWWKCNNGHEWQAVVSNRTKGTGCPYCYGRYAIKGVNDLNISNSILVKEWNFEKNGRITPSDVLHNSNKKVWWRCANGHEWQAKIVARSQGNNCPYCAGQKVLKGCNDLQTVNPELANEWNCDKNGLLLASDVMPNSNKKVWWKCSKGHEWEAIIATRNKGIGCPICSSERNTSLPEYMILYYLKKYGVEAMHTYKGNGYELDIYIPSQKIAIEYDGYFWHGNKIKKDLEKNKKCTKDNITLYRVREGLPLLNDSSIDYVINKNRSDLPKALASLLHAILGVSIDINLERDAVEIENLREHVEKEGSILFDYPQLALEWNYEKNGTLRPEHCTSHSNKKVWWKCNIGHEWKAVINSRSRGNGCPYCCGRFAIAGENDLQTINPSLASEWNYDRNGGLSPQNILPSSNKRIWWKCSIGHEWQTSPNSRIRGGNCPYCSNKKVLPGYNDLQTVNPSLALEWNLEKNGGLMPKDVTSGSGKKVWWNCRNGHEWQARVCNRSRGNSCMICARTKQKTNN